MDNDSLVLLRALGRVLAEADKVVSVLVKLVHGVVGAHSSIVADPLRAVNVLNLTPAIVAVVPVVVAKMAMRGSMSVITLQVPSLRFLELFRCSAEQTVEHVRHTAFVDLILQQLAQLIPETIFLFVRRIVVAEHAVVLFPLGQDRLVVLSDGNGTIAVRIKQIKLRFVLGLVSRIDVVSEVAVVDVFTVLAWRLDMTFEVAARIGAHRTSVLIAAFWSGTDAAASLRR